MSQLGDYVPGYGSQNAKLAIVGIAPGIEEVKARRPFVGPSGKILRADLAEAGIDLDDCYRTNVFKYLLPDNQFKRYQEIGLNLRDALVDLQEELNVINPNCVLGLGDPVLYSLAGKSGKNNGINVWRGSILRCNGIKSVFTWHPAHELHAASDGGEAGKGQWKSWQKYVRKFDVKRAVEQSKFPELRLPQRLLRIARSSADVYRFLEKNYDQPYCAVDIEPIEGIPVCIGLSFQSHEALTIPLWRSLPIKCKNEAHPKKSYSYTLEVSQIPEKDLAFIWKLLAQFFQGPTKFIGQNFKYDEDKLNNIGFYLRLFWDTLIGAHCISSEMFKGLAFLTSINTEEPYYKIEGKNFVPGKDSIEDFYHYNGKDACVTREIFDVQQNDLKSIPHGLEHATWRMGLHYAYLHIDRAGFAIDETERTYLINKYVNWLIDLEVEFQKILAEFGVHDFINIRSHPKVHELLYKTLGFPKRDKADERTLTALIGNNLKDQRHIRIAELILEHRRVDKSLGYLQAREDYDGRMKTNCQICGTENYRTSTNSLEPPVRPEDMGWAFQTISKHGDIGNDIRSILIADPGFVIVNIDQSQAEARVCSLLANDEDTLRDYDRIDKHAYTAAKFFGGTEDTYSKKRLGYECPERFMGKTLRHAYHLGIGKREAMINVNTDARKYKIMWHGETLKISEWRAGECLKILEQDTPKIQTVFHASIQELLRRDRRIFGTYGASRYFYDEMDTRDLWKGAYSFIPQQTVSDKTKQVLLKITKKLWDVKVCVESHDALTMQIREKVLDERIEEIQSYFAEPISFSDCSIRRRDLVIPTDVEIGYDYCNLGKYRIGRAA